MNNNKNIKNSEVNNKDSDIKIDEIKAKPLTEDSESFWISPWKILYMWPSLLHIKNKAKKISKKNEKYPGTYSEEYRYNWVKKAVKKFLKLANIEVQYEGIENWLDKGVVLVPNHQSNVDPMVLIAINDFSKQQPLAFIAKKELWDSKSMARFVKLIDCIPLDRNNPRSALEAFKAGKDLIVDYKRSLTIFPEGTRSGSQNINEFHGAALKIAQMANAPVIPVTIINSYQAEKRNRKSSKLIIKVIFGKPILASKHITLKTEDLTNNVRKEIINNMNEWKDKELSYSTISYKNKKNHKKKKKKKSVKNLFKIID